MQYEHILALSPNDGDVLFALALIAMQKEDDAQARRYLEKMVRWNKRAGEANYYLGSLAERRADPKAALEHYRQAGTGYEFVPAQARSAPFWWKMGFGKRHEKICKERDYNNLGKLDNWLWLRLSFWQTEVWKAKFLISLMMRLWTIRKILSSFILEQ